MLTITRTGPNRLDLSLSGKLDSAAMATALTDLVTQSEGIEHGRMLYEIGDFEFPTPGAIAVEFQRLPEMFRMIRQFDRAAVLAGEQWIRTISELEGKLFPGLEIKAFEPDRRAEAEAWLEE